jgi:hypothetical protein
MPEALEQSKEWCGVDFDLIKISQYEQRQSG